MVRISLDIHGWLWKKRRRILILYCSDINVENPFLALATLVKDLGKVLVVGGLRAWLGLCSLDRMLILDMNPGLES
jgi:hypothetical protein